MSGIVKAHPWVVPVFRMGYSAKSIVYLTIGVLAALVAFGFQGGEITGSRGAIAFIRSMPFGIPLLYALATALIGYVLWKLTQSIFDTEDKGSNFKGIVIRAGYCISGVIHLSLAATAFYHATGSGSNSSGNTKSSLVARALEYPLGQVAVISAGLIFVIVAFRQFQRAYKKSFMKAYDHSDISPKERTIIEKTGVVGLSARGVVFTIAGLFLSYAGYTYDPDKVKSTAGVLQVIQNQSFGSVLLGSVAIGLIAYSVYCASRAKYRVFT